MIKTEFASVSDTDGASPKHVFWAAFRGRLGSRLRSTRPSLELLRFLAVLFMIVLIATVFELLLPVGIAPSAPSRVMTMLGAFVIGGASVYLLLTKTLHLSRASEAESPPSERKRARKSAQERHLTHS